MLSQTKHTSYRTPATQAAQGCPESRGARKSLAAAVRRARGVTVPGAADKVWTGTREGTRRRMGGGGGDGGHGQAGRRKARHQLRAEDTD